MLASNLDFSTQVFRVYRTVEDVELCDIQRRCVSTCDKYAQGWTTIVEMNREKNEIFSEVLHQKASQSLLFGSEHIRDAGMIDSGSESLPSLGYSLDAMTSGRGENAHRVPASLLEGPQYRYFNNGEGWKKIDDVLLQAHEEE